MTVNQETKDFIVLHSDEDVRKVALLNKTGSGVDMAFALNQIAGRQTARTKLPTWYGAEDVVFPPHISMEQCSSEQTAGYKVEVMERVLSCALPAGEETKNCHFIDFTGGFGVDFSYMARPFSTSTYIERQDHLCDIARHNLPLLGLVGAEVVCADSEMAMRDVARLSHGKPTVVFMDPARRDLNGQRTYAIADCTPNVVAFISDLLYQCVAVMIKLSPMLDWHSAVHELNAAAPSHDAVREIHIVSTGNECKELLLVLSEKYASPLSLHCVNDALRFVIEPDGEGKASLSPSSSSMDGSLPQASCVADADISPSLCDGVSTPVASPLSAPSPRYLLVPNASIMKAGCFSEVERAFGARQISQNSHLFLSKAPVESFPGRVFAVRCVTTMNKKELRKALQGIEKANISTRNFPLSPDNLRKRLKLKDGGDTYIFATTTADNTHILLVCEKAF